MVASTTRDMPSSAACATPSEPSAAPTRAMRDQDTSRPAKRPKPADIASNGSPVDASQDVDGTTSDTNGQHIGGVADTVEPSSRRRLVHPFGVKPIGNYYEDVSRGIRDCRARGLGRFGCLSDVAMLNLLNWLTPKDLCTLSAASRAAYVFGSHDELWRTLVLEEMEGNFTPKTTWKQSYIATKTGRHELGDKLQPIPVTGFYSDLLFQAFYCAAAPIEQSWLAVETIDRRSATEMTLAQFKTEYEAANKPVIITEAIDKWPAIAKWTDEYLIATCGAQTFSAGGFQVSMAKYLDYSRTLSDDQPLFIFDREFTVKVPALAADYDVPEYFQEDLFALLGAEKRPHHRWLIIGPKKSGSTFHIDPNSTNAWNGVIRGAKKWVMFPPEIVPPGVHPSEDGGDVSTPVSLIEWFVTFYPQARKLPPHMRPLEGVCREGEIIFVPNGWWHLVLNLEESIAITQNFVCMGNVKNVMRFLEDKPDQVSGLPSERRPLLAGMLREALQHHHADVLARIDIELNDERARKNRKSKWELLLDGGPSASPLPTAPTASCTAASNAETGPTQAVAAAAAATAPSTFSFGFNFG